MRVTRTRDPGHPSALPLATASALAACPRRPDHQGDPRNEDPEQQRHEPRNLFGAKIRTVGDECGGDDSGQDPQPQVPSAADHDRRRDDANARPSGSSASANRVVSTACRGSCTGESSESVPATCATARLVRCRQTATPTAEDEWDEPVGADHQPTTPRPVRRRARRRTGAAGRFPRSSRPCPPMCGSPTSAVWSKPVRRKDFSRRTAQARRLPVATSGSDRATARRLGPSTAATGPR